MAVWTMHMPLISWNVCNLSKFAAIELIKDLMEYEVKDMLLRGLVKLLRPSKEDLLMQRAEYHHSEGKFRIEPVAGTSRALSLSWALSFRRSPGSG